MTRVVDAAMDASVVYYDALAGATAMHQARVYTQVCNAYLKVQQAHEAFLGALNVVAPKVVVQHTVKKRAKAKGISGRGIKSVTAQGKARNRERSVARAKKVLDAAGVLA